MFEGFRSLVPQTFKNYCHLLVAFLAAFYYRFPARKLKVIGVTGTDGKTTSVHLIYHLLKETGEKVSMLSTVEARIGDKNYSTGLHVTTPNPFQVQKFLREMVKAGSKIAVVEMTSHGLDQNRVAFIPVYTAVVTNVTHEHLDYHKSFEAYLSAKAKILRRTKFRVLNIDDPSFEKLRLAGSGLLSTFGTREEADYRITNVNETPGGVNFKINFKNKQKKKETISVELAVLGRFNAYNAAGALGAVRSVKATSDGLEEAFKSFTPVRGRMQLINAGQDFFCIVDFAHTPAALAAALRSLEKYSHKRIICVFGAAGERDKLKRAAMGKVATEFSDLSIFTSEDPRHEDPKEIVEQIASGAISVGGSINQTFWKIPDRAEAINLAVRNLAKKGDIVAIFGKGHEESMNIAGKEFPWSDVEVASKALHARSLQ